MKLKQIHFTTFLLTASIMLSAAEPSDLSRWKDDFSDSAAFAKHWSSYGFLAAGIDAKNPLGKPVGGKDSRPEWWQIVDGALHGQNFPEEKHGSGISRDVSGKDVRLSCRFKIPAGGMAAVGIRGPNPILEKVFNVVSLHIRTDSIVAADNDVLHAKLNRAVSCHCDNFVRRCRSLLIVKVKIGIKKLIHPSY